jgi:vanillate O-demethylase ferredoxin subunit
MHYTIAVQHEKSGKGGSRYLYDHVHTGDIVLCSLPRNHFRLHLDVATRLLDTAGTLGNGASSAAPFCAETLLVGGGIGITPLLAMAWRLHQEGHAFQLHDFAASFERQVFKEQIAQFPWRDRVTRHVGRCEDFMPIVGSFESGRHLYVCGPFTMIDAVLDAARAMGWPASHLHCERFSAPVPTSSSAIHPADPDSIAHADTHADTHADGVDTAFEVELASSGRRIPIAADQSVGAALIAAGVNIPISCEQGVCGSCLTRVLAGTPDHRDWILSPEEQAANDQFTPCCSRSCSPLLILDL